jgi:hypothetical protein
MGSFVPVHDFSHALDPYIRQKDEALGKRLCEDVIAVEKEFALDRRPQEVARLAEEIRLIVAQAAIELGYSKPG